MSIASELSSLQKHLANAFDDRAGSYSRFAGIIGDRPSHYAKSPVLWNAAFKGLVLDAIFLPFDVDEPKLPEVVNALRNSEHLLGCSVTVPYKVRILDLLDDVDPKARSIGAVNTVARTPEGRLVGYNTDGSGFLASLTSPVVEPPLFGESLSGTDTLLIGAGGAARAVAFYLAEQIKPGRLFVTNRTQASAEALASAVHAAYGNAVAVQEEEIGRIAPEVGLIVNSSTKGQAGLRKLGDGSTTTLEPYSSIAPADPIAFPPGAAPDTGEARHQWFQSARRGIDENNRRSLDVASRVPAHVAAYDLVYAPVETVFLRHFRYGGHRVANGKGMNVAQAVDGFCDRVCTAFLRDAGFDPASAREQVAREMIRVW